MQHNSVNNDPLLVSKLRDGDPVSFEKLYQKHFARLYNFCLNLTQSGNDADEIVQETFIKIWEKRKDIDPERSFSGYIFKVARHKVYKRSIQKIKKLELEQYYSSLRSSRSHITEDEVNYNFLRKFINDLITRLPHMQKKVFIMSRINGLSNREIATQLRLSPSTVENHIHLALKSLKKRLFRFYYLLVLIVILL